MEKVICPKCNSEVEEGRNYCQKCGIPVREVESVKRNARVPLYILLAIVIIASLLIGKIYYQKNVVPKNRLKDYLVEKYNFNKKDIKIVKFTKAKGDLAESFINFNWICTYEVYHTIEYKGEEFEVVEFDPNNTYQKQGTYYDDYLIHNKKAQDLSSIKERIEERIKNNNMTGFVKFEVDTMLDRSRNEHQSLNAYIFIKNVIPSSLTNLEDGLIIDLSSSTRFYKYQIIALNSEEYYEELQNVDLSKYYKKMEGWTELDYKKMMEQEFGVRLDKKMSISSKESGKLIISDGTYLLHKSDRNSECIEPESTSNKVQKDYFYVWDVCQIYK